MTDLAALGESLHPHEVNVLIQLGADPQTLTDEDLAKRAGLDVEVDGREDGAEPRSYSFADAQQASTFVTEAVEALVYLGCEIHA